jgi:hypothetical protein
MLRSRKLSSPNEIRVYSNPFRLKILSLFSPDRVPMNVKQMSVKLGEIPSRVHYHVKELEKINVLEIVETREKSGILEKYYLPTAESFIIDNIIKIPGVGIYEEGQEDFMGLALKEVYDDVETLRNKSIPGIDTGRVISQLTGYLTPKQTRELHDICVNYIKTRQKSPESQLFNCTLLTIKKFE